MKYFWVICLALLAIVAALASGGQAQQVIVNGGQYYPPIPCVTTSAGNPYNPNYPTTACQATAQPFQQVSPTPTPPPTATPGPILVSPTALAFAYPNSSPLAVTITETNYSGTWGVSFSPPGVASESSIVGNQIFFIPATGTTGGSTSATITDSLGNASSPLPITVGTAPPTAGPIVFTPPSLAPFAGPTSTPTTVALSETNYSGAFTATAAPTGCVGTSVVSTTLTVSVLGSGCSATITVTGGQMGQLAAGVGSTPTPLPTPAYSNATPYNGFAAGLNPTPVATTFPQLSTVTVTATIKCNPATVGNAVVTFNGAWALEAGQCPTTAGTNPANASGLHFFDQASGDQAVASASLASATVYFLAGVQNGSGVSIYVCPQAASPAWTCGAPITTSFTGTVGTGTAGYIGIAADDISRQFQGDIWNVGLYPPLTATQVQQLAYTSIGDPYPSPNPGPISVSPSPPIVLPAPTATATFSITDPNYSGTFTTSPTPAACLSAGVSGSTVTLTGNGTTGNCGVTVADSGYNSTTVPVQINAGATSVPSPTYTNAVPTTPYPVSLPTLPSSANETIIASVDCLTTNTTGVVAMSSATTFSLAAGLCNSALVDPTNGTGAHGYDVVGSKQAQLTTPNAIAGLTVGNGLALGQYTIGMSIDGANVNSFVCPIPYVTNGCIENSVGPDTASWTVGTVQGYIGVAGDGSSRNANGKLNVWGVKVYATPLALAQVNIVAAQATSDPYITTAVPNHVLVDLDGKSTYTSSEAAPYVSWVGPGQSSDISDGMKAYNYTDPNEAYVSDNGPEYHDVCWQSATGGRAGKTDNGTNCPSNGPNNSTLALSSSAYVGGGSRFASDPTQTGYTSHVLQCQTGGCGSDFTSPAASAQFIDDTGAQYGNALPTGWSSSGWNSAYASAYTTNGSAAFLFNGLISASFTDYTGGTPSSGADSGGGSSLFGGNGWDLSSVLTGTSNSIGAMWEGCYGGNGYGLGNASYGIAQDWGDMQNYELWMAAHSKLMWCRSRDANAASSALQERLFQYGSFLLTYNLTYSMFGTAFTTSSLEVMPETQLVPVNPLVSAPSLVSSLEIQTGSSACSTSAPNCPFGRAYANCYLAGTNQGACAVEVNPTSSTVNAPYTTGYSSVFTLSGSGILDGGTAKFVAGTPPATLAPKTAAILLASTVTPPNYASPLPSWTNNIAFTTKINDSPATVFSSSNPLTRSYNAAAWTYYNGSSLTGKNGTCGACQAGFDEHASSLGLYPSVLAGGATSGMEVYYAKSSDPTYNINCKNFCGSVNRGVPQSTSSSSPAGSFYINIPLNARTQNSGINCDCHLIVVEYPGFNGQGHLPTLPTGYQYEFDMENAAYGTTFAASYACVMNASAACTTFSNTSGSTQWITAAGVGIQTTSGSGWNDQSSPFDGYYPGVSSGLSGNSGPGFAGHSALTAFGISANDAIFAYSHGYIPHAIGLAAQCLKSPQSDSWPITGFNTDYACPGGVGFAYGDWLMFDRTQAQICNSPWSLPCASGSDVGQNTLGLFQGIIANSCNVYGCFLMDTIGGTTCCGAFYFRIITGGYPAWGPSTVSGTVQNLYGTTVMPTDTPTGGVVVNANFPIGYGVNYGGAVESCVKQNTC